MINSTSTIFFIFGLFIFILLIDHFIEKLQQPVLIKENEIRQFFFFRANQVRVFLCFTTEHLLLSKQDRLVIQANHSRNEIFLSHTSETVNSIVENFNSVLENFKTVINITNHENAQKNTSKISILAHENAQENTQEISSLARENASNFTHYVFFELSNPSVSRFFIELFKETQTRQSLPFETKLARAFPCFTVKQPLSSEQSKLTARTNRFQVETSFLIDSTLSFSDLPLFTNDKRQALESMNSIHVSIDLVIVSPNPPLQALSDERQAHRLIKFYSKSFVLFYLD